jgi:hypothetical protein
MELPIFLALLILILLIIYVGAVAWDFTKLKKEVKKEEKKIQKEEKEFSTLPPDPPYDTSKIMNVDDYEYSMVFQNESGDIDKQLTKAQRDYMMNAYPQDWSTQPPSSAQFQKGLADFQESFENFQSKEYSTDDMDDTKNPYKEIDGRAMTPPDNYQLEGKEREILNTYKPKDPKSLKTYDSADAKEIIKRVYDAKGLIADFKEEKPNVFVVLGTRRKDEKIVYEDEEAPATKDANQHALENTITVPQVAREVSAGLDPFFTPSEKVRDGKWDYTRWTPGLERSFAPNESMEHWY